MKTAGAISRMNLVTQSPTSVEPATIVASGSSTSTSARSSTLAGSDQALLSCADRHPTAVAHGAERRLGGRALAGQPVLAGLAVAGDRPRRPDDRRVAGAAAEIALQGLLDLGVGGSGLRIQSP